MALDLENQCKEGNKVTKYVLLLKIEKTLSAIEKKLVQFPGGRCYDTNFRQFLAKKWHFSPKPML
jgi:hypothetical protein